MLAGHHSDVSAVAWHPNGHYLASGSDDRTLRLWDVRDGKSCRVLVGHRAPVQHSPSLYLCMPPPAHTVSEAFFHRGLCPCFGQPLVYCMTHGV